MSKTNNYKIGLLLCHSHIELRLRLRLRPLLAIFGVEEKFKNCFGVYSCS